MANEAEINKCPQTVPDVEPDALPADDVESTSELSESDIMFRRISCGDCV